MKKTLQWFFISILTILGIIGLDRFSKVFFSDLLALGESIPVIRNIFHFTLVHNTGIAFGFFKDQSIVSVGIPIVAVVLIAAHLIFFRDEHEGLSYVVGFSLILGGAIGNLIDRLSVGYVIDFLDFRIWPVFNVADSAITIGIILLLIKCIPLSSK